MRAHVTAAAVGFVGPVFLLQQPSIDLNPAKAGLVRRRDDGHLFESSFHVGGEKDGTHE